MLARALVPSRPFRISKLRTPCEKWGVGGTGSLRSALPMASWLRRQEGGNKPDRNHEAAVLPPYYLKLSEILFISVARRSHRIAAGEFRDIRRKVSRFERNLRGGPAHPHREHSMLARFQGRCVRFEIETNKSNCKWLRLPFRTSDFHPCGARLQILGRKHHQRGWRGGQHDRGLPRDCYLVGVGIAAETLPKEFKAIGQRRHARAGRNLHRRRHRFAGRKNRRSDSPGAPGYRSKNHAGIQRRHEKGSARRIGPEPVPVREIHRDAGHEPPVHVQHGERGALARNDSPRQQ